MTDDQLLDRIFGERAEAIRKLAASGPAFAEICADYLLLARDLEILEADLDRTDSEVLDDMREALAGLDEELRRGLDRATATGKPGE